MDVDLNLWLPFCSVCVNMCQFFAQKVAASLDTKVFGLAESFAKVAVSLLVEIFVASPCPRKAIICVVQDACHPESAGDMQG